MSHSNSDKASVGVSLHQQAEAALVRSEELKQAFIDSVASHIAVLDPSGVIVAVNSAWQRFTCENPARSGERQARSCGIGANYLDVCRKCIGESADDAMLVHDGIQAVLTRRIPSFTHEYPCHSPTEQRWFTLMATPLGGGLEGVFVVHTNITERKRTEDELRKLLLQLDRAEDMERRRIARELHDSTGQKLAALGMTIGLLQDATSVSASDKNDLFANCLTMVEQCAKEVRTLSYLLHPPLLDELGLASAIHNYVEGFSKRSGVQVTFDASPDLARLPAELELMLFRIVQESLGNIHRHSGASAANIRLVCDVEQVVIEVSDQGCGMSSAAIDAIKARRGVTGVGIAGMQERVRHLGGRLELESCGQGTTVRAFIPRQHKTA